MTADHRQGIACGGIWVVDLVKVVDHYPHENSITYISEMSKGGGGCGHNTLISLARFDAGHCWIQRYARRSCEIVRLTQR